MIVPAVLDEDDPVLLGGIKAQAARQGTIASISLGAQVVANTGLMDGRRATSWWGTEGKRMTWFPDVRWEKNIRYVADGRIVFSAGISASLPALLALVSAIAGRERAAALAQETGVTDWSSRYNSDVFQPHPGMTPLPARSNGHDREIVGVPVTPEIDEVALALTAESYSHNGRTQAVAYAETDAPVRTRHGLLVLPERTARGGEPVARILPLLQRGPAAKALDDALAAIEAGYGHDADAASARIMEYPGFRS